MNKGLIKVVGTTGVALSLTACSSFFTDHSNDYQQEAGTHHTLEVPAGSIESKDALVIPNENDIADLNNPEPFETPRAPFVYYPMDKVAFAEQDTSVTYTLNTKAADAKQIVVDFLTALHGAGQSVASQTDDTITSIPFDFHPQGWWASLWSDITRVHPAKTAFFFQFNETDGVTTVTLQYREVEQGDEQTINWQSPMSNHDAESVAVRLWGTFGRQLNQSSAYLSNSKNGVAAFPVWVDHQGMYAIYLGKNLSEAEFEAKLKASGIYLMPGEEKLLAPVPADKVARVGDIIDFNLPLGTDGKKQKLFNVYRRDLDDVSWQEREYPYQITQQKAGNFLVVDVSALENPEIASFRIAQRFVK
ncbi:hypothetical protein [Marinomonas posidonica]|uniref:hypothetical protein n=1 Tax=Marinomonas posidonica TaxID=936476 RepID=UPI003736E546